MVATAGLLMGFGLGTIFTTGVFFVGIAYYRNNALLNPKYVPRG